MKNDEFIERIREGIAYGMWIRDEVDKQSIADGKALSEVAADSMRTWMEKQIQSMLDNMTLMDIIYISDNRELSPTGVSPRYGDIRKFWSAERKGGLTAADDQTVTNDDEKATHSSTSILPQEDEDGKH